MLRREGRKRTGHSMRGGGRPAQALWVVRQSRVARHDTTREEGGEPGKRFLMGQKMPGMCTYDLGTGDHHNMHMEKGPCHVCAR